MPFLFLAVVVVVFGVLFVTQRKGLFGSRAAVKPLLTNREAFVGNKLDSLVRERRDLRLCPKVRVCDILEIGSPNERRKNFGRHIDFTITRSGDMRPVLCIEVNDSSHDAPARRRRDDELLRLFGKTGVPLLFLRTDTELSYPSLREVLNGIPVTT
jgi:hypothetical protein